MSAVFDLYLPGNSIAHRLDPRVKLLIILFGVIAAFTLPVLWQQGIVLVIVHLALWLGGGISWRTLWSLWRRVLPLIIFIMLLQPWFNPQGPSLLDIGPLSLTLAGIIRAAQFALRATNVTFIVAGLLLTTTHEALVLAGVHLGLPYTWGLTFSLMLRFLPAIYSMFGTVMQAQSARGWVQSARWNPLKRLREYLPILVAVVISTLRMSDQLTLALAARGLSIAPRTRWHDLHMQMYDWLCLGLTVVLLVLLLLWRLTIL